MSIDSTATAKIGRPPVAEVEQRNALLLSVAEGALIELGYEGATLNIIARRARVSKKTIYTKFDGKPGLLRVVLARIADRHMGLDPGKSYHEDPAEGIYRWARKILAINHSEAARALVAISMREGRRFPEFIEAMQESRRQKQLPPIVDYLETLRRRGRIADVDCIEVAEMMLWMLSEDMIRSVANGDPPIVDEATLHAKALQVSNLIVRGILQRD